MTNFTGLPSRQIIVLHAIVRLIEEKGISPTLDEIAADVGGTKQGIHQTVDELVAKNRITRDPKKHRSICLVEEKKALKK